MKKGFSILELLIILGIIAIMLTLTLPAFKKLYEVNRFKNQAALVEYLISKAKILAMSKTSNIGVCIKDNAILLNNLGYEFSNDPCHGTPLFKYSFQNTYTKVFSKGNIIFDPRGLSILSTGEICLYDSFLNKYYKFIVEKSAFSVEEGVGKCKGM